MPTSTLKQSPLSIESASSDEVHTHTNAGANQHLLQFDSNQRLSISKTRAASSVTVMVTVHRPSTQTTHHHQHINVIHHHINNAASIDTHQNNLPHHRIRNQH
jgi:hypothetical protein